MKKRKTAKRGYSKGKNNSLKKCKMSLREKELMAFTIFVFFVFAFLLATINTSQESNYVRVTGHAADSNVGLPGGDSAYDNQGETNFQKAIGDKTSFIQDMFSGWQEGNLDVNIAKYLFFGILVLLITSILSFAKFPKQGPLQFLIALPIAFLATAYITPEQVFTMLTSYTAMGVVLGSLFPFAIVLFFSAMLVSDERSMSVPKILMEVVVWIGFAAVEIYLLISGMFTGKVDWGLNFVFICMVSVSAFSVLLVIFNKPFREWMWDIGNQIREAKERAIGTSEAAYQGSRRRTWGGEGIPPRRNFPRGT